ncbi:MAG: carboxypeptidase regulatory-like domain-containing protein [bacterium]
MDRERIPAERRPKEWRLRRARPFTGDLRALPRTRPIQAERPEREAPEPKPRLFVPPGTSAPEEPAAPLAPIGGPSAPAPAPSASFEGLSFNLNGNGHPPDTNGDVGPNHYIQTINTSIGIYDKATGNLITNLSFNTFMSQGNFGNLCDTNNFGDPVVLYDTFEDRWVITDFAFALDGSGNVINPPGSFQCFAVSRSGDPVSGGWNYYSINTTGGLGDYPKFGVWPDGIYMSANMFGYPAGAPFQNARAYAFNKAQMYAGAPTVQSVSFDAPSADFTILPSNARLQTGTPPPGTPNYFLSTWEFTNAVTVYKFHVDWNKISASTFTGPDIPAAATSWPNANVPNAPSLGGNSLDVLQIRAMMQNQYSNLGGIESLWASHTVRRGDINGFAAPRIYQVPVTGGTVGANITQAATFDPDAANLIYRFMPSVAVDRAGNMALGYSTSSSTTKPAIKYAGRLATDPINTFSQTEQVLIQGAGTQTGNCGGAACTRWGDYSAMTLDPDGCRFWYTNMYYPVDGLDHHTRIGSFGLPQCTTVGSGSVQGTVTSSSGGGPINGATVALGSRTATTDSSGFYSFPNLPAGTYPSISASFPGYTSSTINSVVVTTGSITPENFILSPGSNNGCIIDTSQTDFQAGVPTSVDLTSSPGNVILLNAANVDQQNLTVSNSGYGFTNTSWAAQTFQPAVTGQLTRVDLDLFCSACSGANPNITVSIRATSGDLPTGADLATATIPGFSSGSGGFFTANFASPPTLTAGTRYAIVFRLVSARTTGTQAYVTSAVGGQGPYANGRRATSTNSGSTWTGNSTRDLGFITYMNSGFALSGNLISGAKDANPHAGGAVTWITLSWTAATPAGTAVKFQVAASNSASGPFNFVGPDGTAATFFTTSGASLARFNGLRYLKYEAFLTTNSSNVTPTLNDVTVCFSNTVPTFLVVGSASGPYGGTVNLSATLTDGVSPLSGKTVSFSLNGNNVGSAVTNASGVASLSSVSLSGIDAGSYPTGVGANFAGDASFNTSLGSNSLVVNKANQTINFAALPNKTYGDPDFTVSATVSSGLSVSFAASGQCTVSGSTVHLTGSGSCTITASQAGNTNYNAAPNVPQTFSITSPTPTPTPTPTPVNDTVWVEDTTPAGATLGGNGESWNWIGSNPTPFAGSLAHQSNLTSGLHQHYFYSATETLTVNTGDTLIAYIYLDAANPPSEIMLQWTDGSWEHRAYWGANAYTLIGIDGTASRRFMGSLPAAGQWVRLEVPASQVGLEGHVLNGMAFTLYDGRATWDYAGKSSASGTPTPTPTPSPSAGIWVEDTTPAGATLGGNGESWNWISSNPTPFAGSLAHQSNLTSGLHQHYFYSATETLTVNTGDTLIAYIYLDAANPPSEIMLQWTDGSWEHRAYWGANAYTLIGIDGTASRRFMGSLPAAGQWVRLEVPASQVGLEGHVLNGMAFTLYDGRATWDHAGKAVP